MKSFVVLNDHGSLERACTDLSSQFGLTKRKRGLWTPTEMLGMWVGSEDDILPRNRSRAEALEAVRSELASCIRATAGIAGWWRIFYVENPTLTRARLLDELVASSRGVRRDRQPRFIPVFFRSVPEVAGRSERALLMGRHPSDVGTPLVMNPMTGALSRAEVHAEAGTSLS